MSEDEEKLEEIVPSSGLSKKGPDRDELEVCGAPDDLTDLPEDVQLNISKIKEALHSCDETNIRTADLSFMVSAKPETVAAVCDELETDAIADAKMQLLLRSFSELKSEMSLINGVVFVKCALLPKGPLESVFAELVNWLASVKDERSTDSKFSKLLMDFVSFYGPQMSSACLDSVVKVVSANRTLLKEANPEHAHETYCVNAHLR
ncbi:hypothetical protein HPB51_000060 [Rhipicephalus microplus]|uniref:Uncharacterized protein n=1 Tax=Rhipicephalus microplus TaxID=6941 RepID=A0A9J6DRE7_RHIMP|nr:hypothetical protein HPB51_000060 [Rhipicephalus microplus]